AAAQLDQERGGQLAGAGKHGVEALHLFGHLAWIGDALGAKDLLHLELHRQAILEDEGHVGTNRDAAVLLRLDHFLAELLANPLVDGSGPEIVCGQRLHLGGAPGRSPTGRSVFGERSGSPAYAAWRMRTGWTEGRPVFCFSCRPASGQSLETVSGSAASTLRAAPSATLSESWK